MVVNVASVALVYVLLRVIGAMDNSLEDMEVFFCKTIKKILFLSAFD